MQYLTAIRTVAPTVEPITIAEAKAQLRVETAYTDEDDYIASAISAARDAVERYCGRFFAGTTAALIFDYFPAGSKPLRLPVPDVSALVAISYLDSNNTEQTLTGATLRSDGLEILPAVDWPTDVSIGTVRVEITAGAPLEFAGARQAMLLYLTDIFEVRAATIVGASVAQNPAALMLMQPYRVGLGL